MQGGVKRLLGLFFEQHVYGTLGTAANNQPFLLWSGLARLALRLGLLRHIMVEYRIRQTDQELVPSRGSDPDARGIGHAVANRACLPVPALGDVLQGRRQPSLQTQNGISSSFFL